jgi:hypothetical protein
MYFITVEAEACDVKLHAFSVLSSRHDRLFAEGLGRCLNYSAPPTCTAKLNQQLTASPFFLAGENVQ